jgi:hypothetical protein
MNAVFSGSRAIAGFAFGLYCRLSTLMFGRV